MKFILSFYTEAEIPTYYRYFSLCKPSQRVKPSTTMSFLFFAIPIGIEFSVWTNSIRVFYF